MNTKGCKITFLKNNTVLNVDSDENLMARLRTAGIPVGSSCDGDGICGKCALDIIEGAARLHELTEREQALAQEHNLSRDKRLSCQVRVSSDIKIDAAYW